jgi:phosphoglycolate phosphatase
VIGVIFDLDGTLLDTLADLGNSVNSVLEARGFEKHPMDAYRVFVGNGVRKLVERAFPDDYEDIDGAFADFMSVYRQNLTVMSKPYEGILELLRELENRGVKVAIATNKAQDLTDLLVPVFFSGVDFVDVVGDRFDGLRKPNPHYPLVIKAKMEADIVYFVGDSDVDMVTAKAADMIAVGVSWGFRGVRELSEAGASFILKKPEDLLEFMKL